jgi:hypothetical protein
MAMTTAPVPRSHRMFYAVILAAAAVVAAGGLLAPETLAQTFTWFTLPPLHARFLGSIYLFGTITMLGSLLARDQFEVRWALLLIALFTAMLFVVSLLNFSFFDTGRLPVLVWLASYIVYPSIAVALFLRSPRPWPRDPNPPNLPQWARSFFLAQGVVVTAVAVALLVLPDQTAGVWPWPVTHVLAQAYSGPLLSYGLGSLLASQFRTWAEARTLIYGMLAFAAVALLVSVIHAGVFGAFDVVDVLWFGSLAVATAALAAMTVKLVR